MRIAVYGPLPAQFARVIAKLPPGVRRDRHFVLIPTPLRQKGAARADVHILWTRFASHGTQDMILASVGGDRQRLWLTPRWSVVAVLGLLGLAPAESPQNRPHESLSEARVHGAKTGAK